MINQLQVDKVSSDRWKISVPVVLVHQYLPTSLTRLRVQVLIVTQPHEELGRTPVVESSRVRYLGQSLEDDELGRRPDVLVRRLLVEGMYDDPVNQESLHDDVCFEDGPDDRFEHGAAPCFHEVQFQDLTASRTTEPLVHVRYKTLQV